MVSKKPHRTLRKEIVYIFKDSTSLGLGIYVTILNMASEFFGSFSSRNEVIVSTSFSTVIN
jgi:hypothetical protein